MSFFSYNIWNQCSFERCSLSYLTLCSFFSTAHSSYSFSEIFLVGSMLSSCIFTMTGSSLQSPLFRFFGQKYSCFGLSSLFSSATISMQSSIIFGLAIHSSINFSSSEHGVSFASLIKTSSFADMAGSLYVECSIDSCD